jgi:hypothetical protein
MDNLANNDVFRDATDKMIYWSKLFGVMSYILGVLMILGGIVILFSGVELVPGVGGFTGIFYILLSALYFYPGKLLLDFSKITRQALDSNDNEKFAEGFIPMGQLFKFWGVITIIMLGVYALMFLIGILGALFS